MSRRRASSAARAHIIQREQGKIFTASLCVAGHHREAARRSCHSLRELGPPTQQPTYREVVTLSEGPGGIGEWAAGLARTLPPQLSQALEEGRAWIAGSAAGYLCRECRCGSGRHVLRLGKRRTFWHYVGFRPTGLLLT